MMNAQNVNTDNYVLRLMPFIVASAVLHIIALLVSFAVSSALFTDNSLSVTTFLSGEDEPTDKKHGSPLAETEKPDKPRQRIYRVDYFNTLMLETPIDPSKKPPLILEKPVEIPIEKPAIEKPVENISVEKPIIDDNPIGRVLIYDELQTEGQTLKFPQYSFDMIPYNEKEWKMFSSFSCHGFDIIYFVVDISKKDGFEEYFEWAMFWDYLLSLEGVADPPTPIGIVELIEDPYFLTPDMASDALKRRIEILEYNMPFNKNYNFIDVDGQIRQQLEIEELEKSRVYLVDRNGFVRILLEGRIADVPMGEISKAVKVIGELWGMNQIESALATAAILSYQQKLIEEREKTKTP